MLARAKAEDAEARAVLFRELSVRLRLIVEYRLYSHPKDHYDDIVQDALLVVADKLAQIESEPHLYALAVLRNKTLHYLRNRGSGRTTALPDSPDSGHAPGTPHADDIHEFVFARDLLDRIKRAAAQLTPICREILAQILQGEPPARIWERQTRSDSSLKRGTFDKRVFDCRRRLRALIEERRS